MWLTILMTACSSVGDYLPRGPVLNAGERAEFHHSADLQTSALNAHSPVLPFQVFGLEYPRDVVLEVEHPSVSMLEIASLDLPEEKSIWIAKIATPDGEQILVSDREEVTQWLPEINAQRMHQPDTFSVSESPDGTLSLELMLPNGDTLQATAVLSPVRTPSKTNSSTFNHSEAIAMAVLEVSGKRIGIDATMRINQQPVPPSKVFGVIPVKALLRQTQGGISTSDIEVHPEGSELHLIRPDSWAVPGVQTCIHEAGTVSCPGELSTAYYRYSKGGFFEAEVIDFRQRSLFKMTLNEPLPPLDGSFEGIHSRTFMVNVGQLPAAGHGELILAREKESVTLDIRPQAPTWFAERPMQSRLLFSSEGAYRLETIRMRDGH